MSDLTAKQQRFVEEYLVDLNATQAAIRAGYSEDTARQIGSENLSKPYVAEAIAAAQQARAERTQINADYVLTTIRETIERCRQVEPVLDRKGEHVVVETADGGLAKAYTFDSKGVLKGCELLGKNLALWKERIEHTGKDGGPIEQRIERDETTLRALTGIFERIAHMGQAGSLAPGLPNGAGMASLGGDGPQGHGSPVDAGSDSGGPTGA